MDAKKFDGEKSPISLIPRAAIVATADVLAFGAKKYDKHNWRKGMAWSRLLDAAMRHITAFTEGEDKDPESGLSHIGHALCCLSFLAEYEQSHPELDDRYKDSKVGKDFKHITYEVKDGKFYQDGVQLHPQATNIPLKEPTHRAKAMLDAWEKEKTVCLCKSQPYNHTTCTCF